MTSNDLYFEALGFSSLLVATVNWATFEYVRRHFDLDKTAFKLLALDCFQVSASFFVIAVTAICVLLETGNELVCLLYAIAFFTPTFLGLTIHFQIAAVR
jgi:hypothetical protein